MILISSIKYSFWQYTLYLHMTDYRTPLIYILLQVIVFAFREFAILGANSKCQSAVLRYYDGENVGRAPQEFCGTELPSVTRSSGNVVVFELYLTGDYSWSGFRVDYTAVHNASDSRYPVIGIGKIWEEFTRSMRSMHVDRLYNNHSRYCFSRQWINTLITNALPDNDLMNKGNHYTRSRGIGLIWSSDNDSAGFWPPGSLHTLGADGHI